MMFFGFAVCQVRSLAEASSGGDQQIEALQKELAAVQEVSGLLMLHGRR